MLTEKAIACEYVGVCNVEYYRSVRDLDGRAQQVLDLALERTDRKARHRALLRAGGLCLANHERADRTNFGRPPRIRRMLKTITPGGGDL